MVCDPTEAATARPPGFHGHNEEQHMKVKQTPISQAVFIALLGIGGAATAQQAPAPAQQQLETVVVTGIRAAQEKSLSVKRNADTHIDVVSAEDIGKMPDKNVADSLARVPGVTILNSPAGGSGGFDERDRVGLRGTNPSLTQTLLDGHGIANGDWFVLDQTGAGVGRSVSYSLLPSELVSRVEVHKNASASDIEGGAAGSVNIITRKPLDFTKALTFEAGIGAVYADLPRKTDPQISALLNWKNDAKTFGLLVQAFSEKRNLRRDGVETLGFISKLDSTNAPKLTAARPDLIGVYTPDLIGAAYFTQERERKGGLLRAQFKPSSDVDFTLTGFTSKLDANNYNRNYLIAPRPGLIDSATISNYQVVTDSKGVKTLTSATFTWAQPSTAGYYDMISRKATAESNFLSLDGSWRVSNALKLSANAGMSAGKGQTLSQDVLEEHINTTSASYGLNGTGTAPSFSFASPNLGADWIFGAQNVIVHDKENWAQIDGEYTLDAGALKSLKFGLRGAEHKRYTDPTVNQGPKGAWATNVPAFSGSSARRPRERLPDRGALHLRQRPGGLQRDLHQPRPHCASLTAGRRRVQREGNNKCSLSAGQPRRRHLERQRRPARGAYQADLGLLPPQPAQRNSGRSLPVRQLHCHLGRPQLHRRAAQRELAPRRR